MTLFEEFQWRGMVAEVTDGVAEALAKERVTAYIGFDPTASSLHVGNMLTAMGLARLQKFGHTPIAIVGGGTGMIGDPSGKSQERNLLSAEQIEVNVKGVRAQLERFLDFNAATNPAKIINNAEWLGAIDLLSYLRDVGKHFTVNYMLQKESVSRRIESTDGISYTEFSYLILQALRFPAAVRSPPLHVADGRHRSVGQHHRRHRADSQGPRQEGARTGVAADEDGCGHQVRQDRGWHDLARCGTDVAVQVLPVLPEHRRSRRDRLTSRCSRGSIAPMIDALEKTVADAPEKREAQRTLAREVTTMVHGVGELERAERASKVLFGGSLCRRIR